MDEHNYDDEGELSDDEFQELSFDDLLKRVESNDPSLPSVRISTHILIPNNDGGSQHRLDRLATAIDRNAQLKALMIDGRRVRLDEAQTTRLFRGIACNQSIMRFHFNNCGEYLGNACRILTPLFKRNQVERIRIDNCDLWLARIQIDNCNLGTDRTRLLVTSLAEFDSLKEFALTDNRIIPNFQGLGRELMQALSCHSGLRKLDLTNTCLEMLGCSALVDLLSTTIKVLNLGSNIITPIGCRVLFGALDNPTCVLEDLDLSNNQLNDEVMDSLIDVLASNSSLKSLNLSINYGVTGAWRFFSIVLSNPSSGLEKLDLSCCNIDDAAILALTNALLNNTKLKVLKLYSNRRITNTGWEMFSSVLESPNTALEELRLGRNEMTDATCTALLNSLAGNKKLKKLMLDRSVDWEPPVSVLCNTTSIMSTYNSNNTLEKLGREYEMPEEFESLLQINRENIPIQAARLKIIKAHFNEGFVTQPFVDMDLNVLPRAMAWMGRNGRAGEVNDHFYGFIRSISSLFENVN